MALDVQTQHPQSLQESHVVTPLPSAPIQIGGHNHRIATTLRHPTTTLYLFHHHHHNPSPTIELDEPSPLPFGWQKFLNLQTGEVYYSKTKFENEQPIKEEIKKKMSRRNGPKLDLKLNLSPPRTNHHPRPVSPTRSLSVSPPSSCVSSELNQQDESGLRYSTSPEATSMMLVGCPRCLMYVMLSEEDPRCPKCKSTVLLDVVHDAAAAAGGRKKNKS